MEKTQIKVLLIEDNPGDARLVQTMLAEDFNSDYSLLQADRLSTGLNILYEGGIDVVLLDLTLPDSQELHTINWVFIQGKGAPVIVLTGIDDEKLAVETVKAGAQDYLVKGRFDGKALARSIRYALERQRLTEELLKAQEDVEQSKRLIGIGTLAATLAHRLRTPLAAIRMAGFNISGKTKNDSIRHHLDNINIKVQESDRIINNLLRYSTASKEIHSKKVEIHTIINECINDLKKRYSERKVIVDKKYELPQDLSIEADEVLLKELLNNIIDNSYEALTDRGGRLEVGTAYGKGGDIKISVKDDGAGIKKEDLKKLQTPFFTTKVDGMGLGLVVSWQIIKLHNGSMSVDSAEGKGTTVVITLPAASAK